MNDPDTPDRTRCLEPEVLAALVDRYNIHRYHESPDTLTPADAYQGRGA